MKLFVIYIGGRAGNSNIEVHDLRFALGHKVEDCYDQLRIDWWGRPETLHLDCWGSLEYADGYRLSVQPQPYTGKKKLYFINLGGYSASEFSELHKNVFVVAESNAEAKSKAVAQIADWDLPHKDVLLDIDTVICLNEHFGETSHAIHIEKSDKNTEFSFTCDYVPIAKK